MAFFEVHQLRTLAAIGKPGLDEIKPLAKREIKSKSLLMTYVLLSISD